MRYYSILFSLTLIAFLGAARFTPAQAQNPVAEAQKWAKEAKDQQAKAEEAAKKLDCEKPKAADKKALADAVKKAKEAAKNAQTQAGKANKAAEEAGKVLDQNPKNKQAQKNKEAADQTAKDAQAAADEAAKSAKAAMDQAPGMAAADAIEKELDKADVSGNSKKKEAVDRLKKAANDAAEANPCDPEEVKRAVRVELEKIKKESSRNGEMKPWVESLGDKLKNNELISMPAGRNDALIFTATGTGRTTGHIADLAIYNPGDQPATVELGPCFIPSGGQYQPYVVPSLPPVTVPPHSTTNVPVQGYCADIFTAPVPAGAVFPPVTDWINAGATAGNWQPLALNGWQATNSPGAITPTIPGTHMPLGHTIDTGKYPAEAAPILLDALQRIAQAYDQMRQNGAITTPFSGNPEKERESVIQQTFWIYAAELSGRTYKQDHFRENTLQQFESASGQDFKKIPADQQKQINQGVQDFWNTFSAVGAEAKVLKTGPAR